MFSIPEVKNVLRPAEKPKQRTIKARDGDYIEINPADVHVSESHRSSVPQQSRYATPYLNKLAKLDRSYYSKPNARSSSHLSNLIYTSSQASLKENSPKPEK